MQLIAILAVSVSILAYLDQIPETLQLPLPLVGFAAVIFSMLFVLAKA